MLEQDELTGVERGWHAPRNPALTSHLPKSQLHPDVEPPLWVKDLLFRLKLRGVIQGDAKL